LSFARNHMGEIFPASGSKVCTKSLKLEEMSATKIVI